VSVLAAFVSIKNPCHTGKKVCVFSSAERTRASGQYGTELPERSDRGHAAGTSAFDSRSVHDASGLDECSPSTRKRANTSSRNFHSLQLRIRARTVIPPRRIRKAQDSTAIISGSKPVAHGWGPVDDRRAVLGAWWLASGALTEAHAQDGQRLRGVNDHRYVSAAPREAYPALAAPAGRRNATAPA